MTWKIPLFDANFGPEEEEALISVIRRGWVSAGPETKEFEREFSEFLGGPEVVFLSSGTASIHLALAALNIGPGDEVIAPGFTYIATCSPVLWLGGTLRLADSSSLKNPNISPETIEGLVNERTKAVIFLHYAGFSDGISEIAEFCRKRGLFLVEDAAHTHGSVSGGKKPGTFGNIGCFSFFANKNMTSGEGGALVTFDRELAERVRRMSSHGRTAAAWDRFRDSRLRTYDITEMGYNYKATDMQAALARVQLRKLPEANQKRVELVGLYRKLLSDVPGLIIPFDDYENSANYIFPVVLPEETERLSVMEGLAEAGIQTSVHYQAVHTFTYYRRLFPDIRLPVAEELSRRELSLPLYPHMGKESVRTVAERLRKLLRVAP
ncbi:MAG: DegT/DnrJ/EryC1/StrS family aminotransferase [candidate division WOR-3 bacterium]